MAKAICKDCGEEYKVVGLDILERCMVCVNKMGKDDE